MAVTTRSSKEDYVARYAKEVGMGTDWLLERMTPLECDCGDDVCEGWIMIRNAFLNDFLPGGCFYASRFPEVQD